jgi:hypothetical protein
MGGRLFRIGVDTALALCNLNILICRCIDAKTSCKIKKAGYSLIKQSDIVDIATTTKLVRTAEQL